MKWAAICVCFLALIVSAMAQARTSEPKTPAKASLQGSVVKEPSGEPLKKAIIELIGENQEEGGNFTATSDQDGHFAISAIPPGRYRIFVERSGFLEVDEKRRRSEGLLISLEAGQELKDQTLHMLAAAVLTGRVIDEDGDPMANVEVTVLSPKSNTFDSGVSARTNDLGEYRIGGLPPGKYLAIATPAPGFQSIMSSKKDPEDPGHPALPSTYGPTYYPGVAERAQAAPLELRAGQEVPADFSLARRHLARVRGKVIGLPPDSKAVVLLRSTEATNVLFSSDVERDGKFEVPNVPPGSYAFQAITVNAETPLSVRQQVEVGTSDVEDLELGLLPPATLRGHVRFDKKFPKSQTAKAMVFLRQVEEDDDFLNGVTLSDEDGASSRGVAKLKADGTFELRNVSAGTYEVSVSGDSKAFNEAYVESLTVGAKDFVDTGLNVNGGTVAMIVAVSSEPGVVEGTVTTEKGVPISDAVVVAVPEARFRKQTSRYQKVPSDQTGRFSLRGLRPGIYTLFAWEHLEEDEYRDAEFLKPYEGRGVEVKVEKASRQTVNLKIIATLPDQP